MSKIYCEVNKKTMLNNIDIIKNKVPGKKLIAVLKSNAYGLGIEGVSDTIDKQVDMYAVSSISEYEKLRTKKDVLLMSPLCSLEDFEYAKNKENIILSIDNVDILNNLNTNDKYRVHLCVDTGNHRVGLRKYELDDVIIRIASEYTNISIEGIYTHFHNCKDKKETLKQINAFKDICDKYKAQKFTTHCIASSVFLNNELLKSCDFTNAIRVGNVLYGMSGTSAGLKKCYTFKAKILQKHIVKENELVGFGASYHSVKKDTVVGIIEAGHIHGLGCIREKIENPVKSTLKSVKNNIKGINYIQDISIIGAVNMNSLILDITNCRDLDEVVLNISPIIADTSIKKIYM